MKSGGSFCQFLMYNIAGMYCRISSHNR